MQISHTKLNNLLHKLVSSKYFTYIIIIIMIDQQSYKEGNKYIIVLCVYAIRIIVLLRWNVHYPT